MTRKRQSGSSVISVIEDDTMDLSDISDDSSLEEASDAMNYMNVEMSTDSIEDIVTSKMDDKVSTEDIYMLHSTDEVDPVIWKFLKILR